MSVSKAVGLTPVSSNVSDKAGRPRPPLTVRSGPRIDTKVLEWMQRPNQPLRPSDHGTDMDIVPDPP